MGKLPRIAAHGEQTRSPEPHLGRDTRGAVFVEFLIAFLPVYVFFLCLIQLALLFSVRLVTEHAAVHAARAAAVVIGDDGKGRSYASERPNELNTSGQRYKAVRNAALLTLAPMILSGMVSQVSVLFPDENQQDGAGRTGLLKFAPIEGSTIHRVRVRVEVEALCRISFANRIACGASLASTVAGTLFLPTRIVRAEAIFPYQGARYEYKK